MTGALAGMQFLRSRDLDQALDHLAQWGDNACILAGGTDVMPQFLGGELAPGVFVHIEGIEKLAAISQRDRTTLGPLVTHRTLGTSPTIQRALPALAGAARLVGGWQTQVAGTVGGNICNASPAADTAPPLLVADATVTLSSSRGERRMAIADFLLGRRKTALEPDELLTEIDLEPLGPGAGEVYIKLGRRGAMEVALVGIAVRLGFTPDGSVGSARIALASVGPTPRRVLEAEAALVGSRLGAEALDAAGEALRTASSPIDDARASASYRIRTLAGLLERAAKQCQRMSAL